MTRIRCAVALGLLSVWPIRGDAADSFTLEASAATMTQIVLQWEDAPLSTASFELQRATNAAFTQNLKAYAFDKSTFLFSDTNRPAVSKTRFIGNLGEPLLDRNTTYYYRVRAVLQGGGQQFSNVVQAQVSEPVRGVEGDLWADVVLGKPDFAQNVVGQPTKYGTFFGGGVLVDRTVQPNRMYIADCNNNRILGLTHLGVIDLGTDYSPNHAQGRPYVKSANPTATYPDAGNAEFTDGVLSTSWTNSFGYTIPSGSSITVNIDVDLGSAKEFNYVVYSMGGGTQNYRAASLTVSVSNNGQNWTQVAQKDNPNREAEIRVLFSPVSRRYVRFSGTSQQYVQGSIDWFFIGEGKVERVPDAAIAELGGPCSSDSDCQPGNVCRLTPERGADIVIGQPDFGSSAGNGDSCAQTFPYRGPASASSLCLTLPTQISMGETIVVVNMALDSDGNLYVPDVFNNRILKYENPFGSDAVADEVWGQNDFTGAEPNKGQANPSSSSLRFTDSHHGAVTFDASGNMWVADTSNHRVLRFPKNAQTGVIAKSADLVLGQQSFAASVPGGYSRTLAQLWIPRDVEFDSQGRLYVGDGDAAIYDGRIVVFDPPFTSGMSAAREMPIPMTMELNPEYAPNTLILGFSKDVVQDRFWFQKNSWTTELAEVPDGTSVTSVLYPTCTASDVDRDGNLFLVAKWYGTYRYRASTFPLPWSERANYQELAFAEGNAVTADTTGGILGITTFGEQLIISERSRMLIWNDYDLSTLDSGAPADDVYGEVNMTTITYQQYFMSPQADGRDRLWVCAATSGGHHFLKAFGYPLSHNSSPVKQIPLVDGDANVLPVLGGGSTRVASADAIDFAVVGSGDKIWIADRNMSRVLRLNNVDGVENPGSGPYVDIVLGQENLTDGERNQGGDIGPQGLATPYNVGVSADGDLFISDNGGEVGSNRRIIQYDADRFPDNPPSVLFNSAIGNPDRVIGTGGSFTTNGLYSADPVCSPFELGLHPQGFVVAPMNGYSDQRFPLVYLDPVANTQPQIALGDFTSYPVACYVDPQGNVYVGDYDWYRVLIYRRPFSAFGTDFRILSIERVPATQSVRVWWLSRGGRSYSVLWSGDTPGPSSTWLQTTGPESVQPGTGAPLQFTDDGITTVGTPEGAPLSPNVLRRFYKVGESRE